MDRKFSPRLLSRTGRVLAGEKRVVQVANPAAGTDWVVQVPGGRQWYVVSALAVLTTSAVVANRFPQPVIGDETDRWFRGGLGTPITATNVVPVQLLPLGPENTFVGGGLTTKMAVPDAVLPSGTTFGFITANIDAGDQWSAIRLFVEEYWASDQSLSERHYAYERAEQLAAEQAAAQIGAT